MKITPTAKLNNKRSDSCGWGMIFEMGGMGTLVELTFPKIKGSSQKDLKKSTVWTRRYPGGGGLQVGGGDTINGLDEEMPWRG